MRGGVLDPADLGDPETFAIIGAAMEVHRHLGHGFLEFVYHEALAIELSDRGIPHRREFPIPVVYKGTQLECGYRAEFICYGDVVLEIKAAVALTGADEGQLINYLKATGYKRGLLLNFGAPSLQHKRRVFSYFQSVKSAKSVDRPSR